MTIASRSASALAIFALCAALYLLTALGRIDSYDGEMMYRVAESIGARGSLVVTDEMFHASEPYAIYGLGTSIALLPFYGASRLLGGDPRWWVSLFNPLVTAATVALFFHFARQLGVETRAAIVAALAFAFGSLAWPYTKTLFSEPMVALLLLLGAYAAYELRRAPDTRWAVLLGAASGAALLTREECALVLPLLVLYVVLGRPLPSVRVVLSFALPLAAFLILTWWYYQLRYGDPFGLTASPVRPNARALDMSNASFLTGFYGQLFSSGKGILWYTPLAFLAPVAWTRFGERARPEALLLGAIVAERLVLFSFWPSWFGGVSWGPRFLVSVLPLALLPLAFVFGSPEWRRGIRLWLLGAILAASVLVQLPGVAIFYTDAYDVAIDELHGSWDQIYFVPRYSPLIQGFRLLARGQHALLLPASAPLRLALVLVALGAAAYLLAPRRVAPQLAAASPTRS